MLETKVKVSRERRTEREEITCPAKLDSIV